MVSSVLPPLLPRVDAILVLDGEGNRLAGKYYGDFLTSTTSSSSKAAMSLDKDGKDKNESSSTGNGVTVEDLRSSFERQLQAKIQGIAARSDAAEVVTVMGKTAVFCGGTSIGGIPAAAGATANGGAGAGGAPSSGVSAAGDVRVVHIGPNTESELLLAHLCEGMYDALANLMGGQTDRNMILDNLELVFLLIDEHCDGGIILEVDGNRLASSVLLRDDDDMGGMGADSAANGGMNSQNGAASGPTLGMGGGFGMQGDAPVTVLQAFAAAKNQLLAGLNSDGMDGL
mmetsp:Transcript_11943/g.18104  ORF Transcript_11943/g.18104 Transcript_11943/m.18104 type:complete len:286 (-) Transcript_11943:285-1142(-)|eukprot:CAMPEP_0194081228 /NCGR_PEP_ID=MMETSP0149-20130528/7072_1 /TAXON_ID=122233 /ORGANISM="Chaetoceros debilis, Strain MM31A-1" /LENGTH=285 /DNA_ID=CAMNT_0038763113 /DNA_START=115 /DNA_END=972 /DNA_ORIENTATION=-